MAHAGSSGKGPDKYCKDYDKFGNFVNRRKLKEAMKTHGNTIGLCRYINESVVSWKVRKINIAVAGITGSGKSSLINTLRGLKPGQKGAAEVGVTETTRERKQYTYPENRFVSLWDLPGLDSPTFKKETYIKNQIISEYDVVIVVTAGRFHENDMWLANECLQKEKNVLFVRTKVDTDIENDKIDHPNTSEEQCLQKIKKNMIEHMAQGNMSSTDCDVFLVSSRKTTSYDFGRLDAKVREMINIRGEAIQALLKLQVTPAIEKKRDSCKTDFGIRKVASVITGFLPIPYLETAAGNKSIYEITKECLTRFCLDEESLDTFCKEVKASKDEIMAQLESYSITEEEKQNQYESTEDKSYSVFKKYSKYMLPGFGSLFSAHKSYEILDTCLENMCDDFAKDELILVGIRLKELEDDLRIL